jgi:hypothetical protein
MVLSQVIHPNKNLVLSIQYEFHCYLQVKTEASLVQPSHLYVQYPFLYNFLKTIS